MVKINNFVEFSDGTRQKRRGHILEIEKDKVRVICTDGCIRETSINEVTETDYNNRSESNDTRGL